MPKYLTSPEAFLKCKREGKFLLIAEIDLEKVRSTIRIAESDVAATLILRENLSKGADHWNSIYKLMYDAFHELAETFLRFEKIKIDNHQCLFAYLCEKNSELELSWDFCEKVRTKRNGIHYYGSPVGHNDWKEVELQFTLYISKLKEEIHKKLRFGS